MTTSVAAGAAAVPRRHAVTRREMTIEGHTLTDVVLAGWAYGPPLGTAPVTVVVGGITASPFPLGDGRGEAEGGVDPWWPALFASDLIDVARTTVVCPCWPGNGSTWRGFDEAPPALSVLGLADLVAAWLDGLDCHAPVTFVGASLGGMVGVAFATRHAGRCRTLITISAGLRPDGWGTGTRHLQRELVRDGLRNGDVTTGMIRARQLGMLTYRGRLELDTRFGSFTPGLERPPVADYLDHHGRRFAERFPVRTFLFLSEAIDRGAIGVDAHARRAALERVTADTIVVGVPGDMLFPWGLQVELHRELQAAGAQSSLWTLDSVFGHDAFLADQETLADLLRSARAFGAPAAPAPRPRFDGVGVEPVRDLRVGLVGCGTVGGGLLEMIDRQQQAIVDRYGVRVRVTRLAVRDPGKPRPALAAGLPMTTDALELVSDPDVDVVVEAAGGMAMEPILRAALSGGKPVVTANKALLASKLAELGVLAERTATPLYCEAAAAAALPIIRHLAHRADEIDSVAGIVNGTCNFVMTRLEQDVSLEEATAEAQARGLAEGDPSADLDGLDAAAKLSILAYRAFGTWVRPDAFPVRGVRDIDPADCDLAESMGCRIRLLAHAARHGDALAMAVEPLLLPAWHLLASVEEEYNAVYLRCKSSGDLSFFGKGAGALPTATAVLGDLIDLAQHNSVRWPVPAAPVLAGQDGRPPLARRHYLRVTGEPHAGLDRRIESLVRRAGLTVQNRASRAQGDHVHLGYLVSSATTAAIDDVGQSVRRLARVTDVLALGVHE
ncbi:MAG: homoserine dehydrogenase [Vicinamibacterales bacterium]